GQVRVRLDDAVRVGGRGVTVLDGSIVVPEDDEDEILEA
ncbi:PhzF family phenazine biosynthesis protein, partial [Natrinema soli]